MLCIKRSFLTLFAVVVVHTTLLNTPVIQAQDLPQPSPPVLEEVVISAQKRQASLQDTPLSVSVLNANQLQAQGIHGLGSLAAGAVPSLRVAPNPEAPSTLMMVIRGNGPIDIGPITRETSVAVYSDGFYVGRPRGLDMTFIDLERIEVLRGPQGSLFGRNAISGAINLVSKKPTGQWGFHQRLTAGRFEERRSVTRINTPTVAGISTKIEWLYAERDGWVDNTAPGEADYSAYKKTGGRLSLNWQPSAVFSADYTFDHADIEAVQNYHQVFVDTVGLIGVELNRQTQTRFAVTPLAPTVTQLNGHGLTANWDLSKHLTLRSLTGYRAFDEDKNGNFAGAVYFNGLVVTEAVEQHQFSQEVQLLGTTDTLEWLAGLYYFRETAMEHVQNLFSLDSFGFITGTPNTPIPLTNVFTTFQPGVGVVSSVWPARLIDAEASSQALYAQAAWQPAALEERLQIVVGARYTEDKRTGSRRQSGILNRFAIDSSHVDPSVTFNYRWTDDLSTYLKWSTGYKAGGVNPRSQNLIGFGDEEATTVELGLKSEWQTIRFNAALFATDYDDMQLDFTSPVNPLITETINAANRVTVDGAELDITLAPVDRLTVGLSYTYLDGHMPLQPNPLDNDALTTFYLTQAPKHAGAFNASYTFAPWRFATLSAHLNVTSTSSYAHSPINARRFDAYTLVNGRITLADISLGENAGAFSVSAWGKNLTDEEYTIFAYAVGNPLLSVIQAFGEPRTVGIDLTYDF